MVTVTDILERASLEELEKLAGEPAVRLLRLLKPDTMGQRLIAEFLVHQAGEASALRDQTIRDVVLSQLLRAEAVDICVHMQAPTADPIGALRGSVSNPAKFERFLGYFKLPAADAFASDEKPSSQRASPQEVLNAHQTAGYRQLRRVLNAPGAKVLVNMPFGAGKMRMIAVAVADLFRAELDGRILVWFAPTDQLCEDAFRELVAIWERYGSKPVTVTRAFGRDRLPDLANMTDGFYVLNSEQFAAEVSVDDPELTHFGKRISSLIVHDAAHMESTPFADLCAAMNTSGPVRTIAVCCTTEFGLGGIGKSGIFSQFPDRINLPDAKPVANLRSSKTVSEIQVEYLTPASASAPSVGGFDIENVEQDRVSTDMARNADLVARIAKEMGEGGNVVFFASTSQQARMFAGVLSFYGDSPVTVTSELPADAQIQQIRRYQIQQDTRVLCVHDVLISGHEVPKVTAVMIAAPTVSATKLSETFGRLATGRGSSPLKLIVVDDGIPGYRDLVEGTTHWSEE